MSLNKGTSCYHPFKIRLPLHMYQPRQRRGQRPGFIILTYMQHAADMQCWQAHHAPGLVQNSVVYFHLKH